MAYMIDRPDPGRQYIEDRMNALQYLDKTALKLEGGPAKNSITHKYLRWVKTEPSYPAFEDFTFAFRNQVFPVLVLRADDKGRLLNPPARLEALRRESERNNLVPCVFPIRDKTGRPFFPGTWNLINPFTGEKIDPFAVSSDSPVEISDWELRNWAVNIVWQYLDREGLEKLSYCDAPGIYPQIWFRDKDGKACWIDVLYGVYPTDIERLEVPYSKCPDEILGYDGYIARVGFAGAEDMSRLYRTQPANVNFRGITQIHTAR